MSQKNKKLSMWGLVFMVLSVVYGFNNIPRAFYLMGYSAIPFYILAAIVFFVPFAFMISEYGAAFKNEKGGIFSWMEICVNTKYAFLVTFMWYASYVIWLVMITTTLMIPVSNAIFGTDTTSTWSLFGLNSTQTLGIISVGLILLVTWCSTRGMDKIKKFADIGGISSIVIIAVLVVGSLAVLIGNHGQIAQPVLDNALTKSPNPMYQSGLQIVSFFVYALFAYGGTEAVGGLVDETENPEKNFGKGLSIAAGIIAGGYALGIFMVGIFTNWSTILSSPLINKGNASYVIMNNLGYQIGSAFGFDKGICIEMGNDVSRLMAILNLIGLIGALVILAYSPLKQLIGGSPKGLFSERFSEMKDDIPKFAMWIQCAVVIVFNLAISMGGEAAATFFNIIVTMTNVSMTLPYMFIAIAFIYFKRNDSIEKPYVIFKKKKVGIIFALLVTLAVGFANIFTVIEPAVDGDIMTTVWSIVGPIVFSTAALILYKRYEIRLRKHNMTVDEHGNVTAATPSDEIKDIG